MNPIAAILDAQFEDDVIEQVDAEGPDSWLVRFGWCLLVEDQNKCSIVPAPGDTLRRWGDGIGRPVRGIGLVRNGELVCVYRYLTADEEQQRNLEWVASEKRKKRESWEASKNETAQRIKALPEPFQQRIEFFMRDPAWGPEFGPYELFVCEEAAKIAAYCGTPEAITELRAAPIEKQLTAGVSDGHSANTHGAAFSLALCFLENWLLVPKMHGAMCPLVGCRDYGCFAVTREAGK